VRRTDGWGDDGGLWSTEVVASQREEELGRRGGGGQHSRGEGDAELDEARLGLLAGELAAGRPALRAFRPFPLPLARLLNPFVVPEGRLVTLSAQFDLAMMNSGRQLGLEAG
jgi:hypothetical protein